MNLSYSTAQLEQFRRDAKRLGRQSAIPHHEALNQVAAKYGAKNWSLLAKHSVGGNPAPGSQGFIPVSTPGRHYLHGDEFEGDSTKYYCAQCDLLVDAGHFFGEHRRGDTLERCLSALERWRALPVGQRARQSRPENALNMLEAPAVAAAAAHDASRGPFHRWLALQKGRNDPIGDLAGDVLSDKGFPVGTKSWAHSRRYLESKGASDEALDALKGAWAEFKVAKL